jgi:predicted glutamine amidotransferase
MKNTLRHLAVLIQIFTLTCIESSILAFQPPNYRAPYPVSRSTGITENALQIKAKAIFSFALQCQLLGMNCAKPTDFSFSFKGFSLRGGLTDVHCHGWGLVFYQGKGIRSFHDPEPCSESPMADLVSNHPLRTYNMIAHIRYATVGAVALENVHPFSREMWGIQFTFAHNGDVPLFKPKQGEELPWIGNHEGERVYNPVGDTDSEKIFCSILNAMKAKYKTLPSLPVLHDYLKELLNEIVTYDEEGTILNFIMGCGEHTSFAYSWPGSRPGSNVWNGLHYVVREPPFKQATLVDCDYEVNFADLAGDDDRVAVIATKPLTLNEQWVEFDRHQLILFDEGKPHLGAADCMEAEIAGHGLSSDVIPPSPKLEEDKRRFQFSSRSVYNGAGI